MEIFPENAEIGWLGGCPICFRIHLLLTYAKALKGCNDENNKIYCVVDICVASRMQ
jgi:hypothetical protein